MAKEYKLEAANLPDRKRWGLYDGILNEFMQSGLDSAKVTIPGKPAKTIQIGLAKAISVAGQKDVKVSIRGGEIFLHTKS